MAAKPFPHTRPIGQRVFKRAVDILAAATGLLLLMPLMLGIALLIVLKSGGPVFHREQRVGRNGHLFTLVKFRTLIPGYANYSSIAPEDDPRITSVGLPLRHSRLDELPQLFNILLGDMSLVGPRPMTPKHLSALETTVREALLTVRPGLTGPASILFFAEDSILAGRPDAEALYLNVLLPAKAQIQLDYLRNWDLWLDINIVFYTLAQIWSPRARKKSARRVLAALAAHEHEV